MPSRTNHEKPAGAELALHRRELQRGSVVNLWVGMSDVNEPRVFVQQPTNHIEVAGLDGREDGLSCRDPHETPFAA